MERLTIPVRGMSCGGCVLNVRRALERLPGVTVETVTVGLVTVSFDPSVTDPAVILATIERAGYAPQAA